MPFNDPLIQKLVQPRRVWWTDKPPYAYTDDWIQNVGKLNLLYVLYGLSMPVFAQGVTKHPLWIAVEEISPIKVTYRAPGSKCLQVMTMDAVFESDTPKLALQVVMSDAAPTLYRYIPKEAWIQNLNKVGNVQSRRHS